MKPKTLQIVLDAYREQLRKTGLPLLEEAMRIATDVEHGRDHGNAEITAAGIVVGMWHRLERTYRDKPEPTHRELERFLQDIKEAAFEIRDEIDEIKKKMPHRSGGAPKALTDEEKIKVCRLIGQMLGDGHSYPEGVKAMAERFNVSTKTIERTWQDNRLEKRTGKKGD